jgi:acetolactate synthase-1/3 small subunit
LEGYEILEIARTGIAGLGRGIENITYVEDMEEKC